MKRLLTLILTCLCFAAGAQNEALIRSLAAEGSLTCKFTMTTDGVAGSGIKGTAWIQDNSYRIESDTFQMMCNGKTRWMYNTASDELVIEKNNLSVLDNPVEKLADGSYRMTVRNAGSTFHITVYEVKQQKEKYPFEYFMMDPDKISLDTIVTDLR